MIMTIMMACVKQIFVNLEAGNADVDGMHKADIAIDDMCSAVHMNLALLMKLLS